MVYGNHCTFQHLTLVVYVYSILNEAQTFPHTLNILLLLVIYKEDIKCYSITVECIGIDLIKGIHGFIITPFSYLPYICVNALIMLYQAVKCYILQFQRRGQYSLYTYMYIMSTTNYTVQFLQQYHIMILHKVSRCSLFQAHISRNFNFYSYIHTV